MREKRDIVAEALFKRRYQTTTHGLYQCEMMFGSRTVTYADLVDGRCASILRGPMLKELLDDAQAVLDALAQEAP